LYSVPPSFQVIDHPADAEVGEGGGNGERDRAEPRGRKEPNSNRPANAQGELETCASNEGHQHTYVQTSRQLKPFSCSVGQRLARTNVPLLPGIHLANISKCAATRSISRLAVGWVKDSARLRASSARLCQKPSPSTGSSATLPSRDFVSKPQDFCRGGAGALARFRPWLRYNRGINQLRFSLRLLRLPLISR